MFLKLLGFVLGFSFTTAASAFAGPGASGGGNAIVCFDDQKIADSVRAPGNAFKGEVLDTQISHIVSVETYDLFEAQLSHGLKALPRAAVPIGDNQEISDYIQRIRDRMLIWIPAIGMVIDDGTRNFPDSHLTLAPDAIFETNDVLPDSDLEPQCVLTTMARQYTDGDQHFLRIDSRLFNHPKHSKLSQAALLLHEYVYSTALARGETDSRSTRILVGMIISENGVNLRDVEAAAAGMGFMPPSSYEPFHGTDYSYAMCVVQSYLLPIVYDRATEIVLNESQPYSDKFDLIKEAQSIYKGIEPCHGLIDCEQRIQDTQDSDAAKNIIGKIEAVRSRLAVKPTLLTEYARYTHDFSKMFPAVPDSVVTSMSQSIQDLIGYLANETEYVALSDAAFADEDSLKASGKWDPASSMDPYVQMISGAIDYPLPSMTAVPDFANLKFHDCL